MKTSKKILIGVVVFCLCVGTFVAIYSLSPAFAKFRTSVKQEVDKESYETKKLVEDTCRAMISSYKSDVITYETYIDSEDAEEQSWAKQAKIRANKTAVSYNEYILKNSFVWEDNVPDDIDVELEIIE